MNETYVIVSPEGLMYVGLHKSAKDAWRIFLGWPSDQAILEHLNAGWYCTKANITWTRPAEIQTDTQNSLEDIKATFVNLIGMTSEICEDNYGPAMEISFKAARQSIKEIDKLIAAN